MSKFLWLLRRSTSLILAIVLLFTTVQLPAFAENESLQTGSTVLTESGSVIETNLVETGSTLFEEQETDTGAIILNTKSGSNILEESSTGEIILEENSQSESLTGSDVLPIAEEMLETGSLVNEIGEKKVEIKKVKKEIKFKKKWTGKEIINLGYVPDEVLIKFKKNKIDLKKSIGKQKMKNFISKKSPEIAEGVIQKLEMKRSDIKGKFNSLGNNQKVEFKKDFLQIKQTLDPANLSLVKLGADESVEEIIEALSNEPDIEYIMPNYVFTLNSVVPNDTYYASQWAFDNTAQSLATPQNNPEINNDPVPQTSTNDSDIDMFDAWDEVTETGKVVVAVLDTGVKYDHSDLNNNMWDGSVCYGTGGTSVEDLIEGGGPNYGWDFAGNDPNPMDTRGHGTGVAGIIAAEQNFLGIAGTTKNVEIMAVRVCDDDEGCDLFDVTQGVYFAKHNGAKIINISLGQLASDQDTQEDLDERFDLKGQMQVFIGSGGLVVASAGNDANNNDVTPNYPSNFILDGLISVAATDQSDNISLFENSPYFLNDWGSNWGANSVDVAAPGVNILTTDKDGNYSYKHATSMAAPFVTGLAAMLWAERPELSATDIKQIIMDTGDTIADLDPSNPNATHPIKSGKRINAYNAMLAVKELNEGDETSTGSIVLNSTIHAKSTGGDWNSYTTWQENDELDCGAGECVLPDLNDIVEINGTVTLNVDSDISGLLIGSGATLQTTSVSNSRVLNVNGDIVNNGVLQTYSGDPLTIEVSGNIENNGTWNPYKTILLDDVGVVNSTTLNGVLDTDSGALVINSPNVLTYSSSTASTSNLTFNGTGKLRLTGSSLYGTIGGTIPVLEIIDSASVAGTYSFSQINFIGNGSVNISSAGDLTLNGDVYIDSGITLQTTSVSNSRVLTVAGDIVNEGILQTYSGDPLTIKISGDIENNGIWNPYSTTLTTNNLRSIEGTLNGLLVLGDNLEITNNPVFTGQLNFNNYALTINSPNIASFGGIKSGTGSLNESGVFQSLGDIQGVTSGDISEFRIIDGGILNTTITTPQVIFTGTGIRILDDGDTTISGNVIIDSNITLQNSHYEYRTLTFNGNVENNGIIKNDYRVVYVNIAGDIINNGIWQPYSTTLLSDVEILNTTTIKGIIDFNNYGLTVNSPNILTYTGELSGNAILNGSGIVQLTGTVGGTISGEISELKIMDGGIIKATINTPKVVFAGSGTRILDDYETIINGNVVIEQDITLQNSHYEYRTLTFNGNVENNGTIKNDYRVVYVNALGNITNNGTWNPYQTNLTWQTTSGATAYDFQITDDNNTWQTPETLSGTSKSIANTYFSPDKGYRWRTRALVNSNYTDWSKIKKINQYQAVQTITASGGIVTLNNNKASVEFPENAINQDLNVNITELDETADEIPTTTTDYALISTAYEFTATDLQGVQVTQFEDNVTLALSYDPTNLGAIEASTLKVNYYDEENEVWVELPSVVDTVNHTVTANVNHFTKFGILGNVIPTVDFAIEDADGNPISGAQFSLDDDSTWQNFPASFDLPYYTQSYDFKFGDYQFHNLFRFLQNNAYEVDLVTGNILSTTAASGTTANFVLDATDVTLKVVDQNYVEIPETKVGIKGIIDLDSTGSGFTLINEVEREFTYWWRDEFYQPELTFEKGKINRWEGGTLTKIDSGSGTTSIEFVLPTIEVSVHTLNKSGDELSGKIAVNSLDDESLNSGETFLMANGGKTHFYSKYSGNTTTVSYLKVEKGKLYQIDTVTEQITTTDTGEESARIEFIYDVIPVVVRNIDQTGVKIGGTVNLNHVGTTSYASEYTYQLANGVQESFSGSYGGESRSSYGYPPLIIEQGKTYRINSYNDRTIDVSDSADGKTYVELQFSVISVICRTVDQYGNNKGGGQFRFDGTWHNTGYKFTMSAGARKGFGARFDNTSSSVYKSFKVSKGKLYTFDSVTKSLTVEDSPNGQTRVDFVFPTVKVKLSTWDSKGNEITEAFYRTGPWTWWTGVGRTINVEKGESNLFRSEWNRSTLSKKFVPQEGKIYEISSDGITTANAGSGVTLSEVRFLH